MAASSEKQRTSNEPKSFYQTYLEDLQEWWLGGIYKYKGNQWDKPLGEDELKILYYPLREIAYIYDYVSDYIEYR